MTIDQHRTRLRRLAQRREAVERDRLEAARQAHAAGLSIDAIREALGLASRMSAHRLIHGRSDR